MFGFGKRRIKDTSKQTRIFFGTDLHGSERTFRKFLNAAKFYQADVLVLGGDIVGKLTIPIIREGGSRYRVRLMGKTEHLESGGDLERLQERLGTLGYYNCIMDTDEFQHIQSDPQRVEDLFHRLARERLESWIDLAEQRLAGTGIKCYVTGGNDDYPEVLELLDRGGTDSVSLCEGKLVQVDEYHNMISVGYSNPTPWHTPREVSDDKLAEMIEQMAVQVTDPAHCIFNIHVPPIDSTLDTCPMLDWDADPPKQISKAGEVVLYGAGSRAVRDAIERYQPLLSLHGHIHESGGVVHMGRTVSTNPGSEYGEGVLRGCLVTLARDKVAGYQLTTG